MNIYHKGVVKNGNIIISDNILYNSHLKQLEGKRIAVIIKEYKVESTMNQRDYLFGVVYKTALETDTFGGWSKDEIHNHYKKMFGIITISEL